MLSLDSEDDSEETDVKERKTIENPSNSDNEDAGGKEPEEIDDGKLNLGKVAPEELNMTDITGPQDEEPNQTRSNESEVHQTIIKAEVRK